MPRNTNQFPDPLDQLQRTDKWYLGGGNRLIWTPPFPVWLGFPGFWDKAHYYNFEIEPVFTWTLLDDAGKEITLQCAGRKWNPSLLETAFTPPESSALEIIERKFCDPGDALVSEIVVRNRSRRKKTLHLVVWTIQPHGKSNPASVIGDISYRDGAIHFKKNLRRSTTDGSRVPELPVNCLLTVGRKTRSYSINLSEGATVQPHWRLTPFYELFEAGTLPCKTSLSGVTDAGVVFAALHTVLLIPPGGTSSVQAAFQVSPAQSISKTSRKSIYKSASSVNSWRRYFTTVPQFTCSDKYLSRYYWYRWYGLRLLTMNGKEGHYRHPSVCEGIGYFRAPISYSAMCHMLENRWLKDPALAQGSLLTFLDNQRKDGGFRGYIDPFYYRQEMFYHANWGNSLRELHRIHPDERFLKRVYDGLVRYVRYFDRERDAEASGLYDIDNHYETGQEFMHRYLKVNSRADQDNWGDVFRLKGVDVTVYLHELKSALWWMAEKLRRPMPEIMMWMDGKEKIADAVRSKMWDPERQMFFDVDPSTGKRTSAKAAVCFYPYMTDIVTGRHLPGLKKHLLNPAEFMTPFPVPSSSLDDEYFSATPEWKGKRMNCPWNGRVWPMTNSHIAEALAVSAIRFNDGQLRDATAEFITKFIRMMFFDGDPNRPNCFEHYNPLSGAPSVYRGVDDYQHSWVNDLILKYVVGVRPGDSGILIDPFPFDLDEFACRGIRVRGEELAVRRKGRRIIVGLANGEVFRTTIGTPVLLTV
jgi:hypothetical protein